MSVQTNAVVTITPAMMAEAFWAMGSDEQVAFFYELANVIKQDHKANKSAYGLGELQWFFTADAMQGDKFREPREMLMAMAAPLYLNILRNANGY